jgi:ATP-dependent helicase/nuclease subunit A
MKDRSLPDAGGSTDPGRNAVIQAAAGTGKTWLLTGRIIRLLLEGSPPGSILAITFTRKAAAEMLLRVRQRLYRMACADDAALAGLLQEIGAPASRQTLARARQLYEYLLTAEQELRATTFHAFCQELLGRFPLEAGVAPGFTLAEQTQEFETAAWRALDADLARRGGELDAALTRLLDGCGGLANTRRALHEFLTHRSDWWAYTENHTDPVGYAERRLRQTLEVDPTHDPIEQFAADIEFRELVIEYVAQFNNHATGRHQTNLAPLQEALADDVPPPRFHALVTQAFLRADGQPRAFSITKPLMKALGAEAAERLIALHERVLNSLDSVAERARRYQTWVRSHAWYTVGDRLLGHYQQIKRERDTLDFADLEWLTYRLLSNGRHAEWVQYKLDQRIDHLLIDEFQDTNPTQWRLLLPLLEEMAAGTSERTRSVFLVGDEKQSIYRFRRADPELLTLARDWLQQHTNAETYDQHVSWRSSPAVIEFVNRIFTDASAAADPAPHAGEYRLRRFHPHATHLHDLWGHAELLPLIPRTTATAGSAAVPFRDPLTQPRVLEEDLRHQQEGELIAEKIQALIGQPIRDRSQLRALRYADIVILLRDRTYASAYEAALRRAHIPYIGAGRGTFLDALEIRDIVQLLTLLITPFDDVALASVLRSPMFAACDADLMALALPRESRPWLERLPQAAAGKPTDNALARAARLLPEWRALADRIPVHDLLDRIYFETDLPARYRQAAPAHLQQRVVANLTRLLALALEVDAGRFPSIARFVAQLGALTADDNESHSVGDSVRVLTIHAAKGLESPVVFVADAARATLRERGVRALIEWPIQEVRPTLFLLSAIKSDGDAVTRDALQRQEQAARREEANLLYVALTRARQLLFVSGCEPRTRNPTSAGDPARAWYGFVERRLQSDTPGSVGEARLQLQTIPHTDGSGAFNVHGAVMFGTVPAVPPATESAAVPIATIDAALTRPFPLPPAPPAAITLNPSAQTVGVPERANAPADAVQRGIVIHRMLDQLTASPRDRAHVRHRLRIEFAAITDIIFDDHWREACAVIDDPRHRELFDSGLFQEARNEVPLLYRRGNDDVVGVIDRLIIRERDLIVLDYKTNRVAASGAVSLAHTYAAQLQLYVEGVRRLWPERVITAVVLFTACSEGVRLAFD